MKLSDAEHTSLLFDEQASDPATPAAGFWRLYLKSGGLYLRNDAGTVLGPFSAGGYSPGGTDVAVADGGTGASTASGARTNLGLVIGTDVQAYDADLADIAGISDAQGDIIVRGASGWERLAKSATATDVLTAGASQPAWAAPSGGGGGGVLGVAVYRPGSNTTLSTTSTTMHDLDDDITGAVVLQVAFTVPASGAVDVELNGQCGNSGGTYQQWGLRSGSSDVANSAGRVIYEQNFHREHYLIHISGLTPSASLTYKWAWKTESAGTVNIYTGPDAGPLTMRVSASV